MAFHGPAFVRDVGEGASSGPPQQRRGSGTNNRGRREKGTETPQYSTTDISIAIYNILDGRNGGLESAARALDRGGVHIAVLQECKFEDAKYATKAASGYKILTDAAGSRNCGGVALMPRPDP